MAEEILTNVAKYGHDDDAEHCARMRLTLDADELTLEFYDDGRPFHPVAWEAGYFDAERPRRRGHTADAGPRGFRRLCAHRAAERADPEEAPARGGRPHADTLFAWSLGEETSCPWKSGVEEGRSLTKTVVLDGCLDNETVGVLDKELDALIAVRVVVLDVSRLEYVTSAGLRSMFRAQKVMVLPARSPCCNPQPQVQKALDIVKLPDLGAVFRNVQELDEYLDAMQKKVAGSE